MKSSSGEVICFQTFGGFSLQQPNQSLHSDISHASSASVRLRVNQTVGKIRSVMMRAAVCLAVLLATAGPAAALRLLPWTPEPVGDAPW